MEKNSDNYKLQIDGYKKAANKEARKKALGKMPWEKFEPEDWYRMYKKEMANYIFKGEKQNVTAFYEELCPNVTWFSHEHYDYFIRNKTDG